MRMTVLGSGGWIPTSSPQTSCYLIVAWPLGPGVAVAKKSGMTVWLAREDLAQQAGEFSPSPRPATTDDNGRWEQSINMWSRLFRIHVVVTTDQNGSFYHWYGRARHAALQIVQQHDPNTNTVPGWPNLDSLPQPRVSDNRRIYV
jgi:hypothetical protein